MTKFKVGDKVIADGDEAVITQIILPDDRNWDDPGMPVWYAVEWPTNEWGTFSEDELRRVGGGMNEQIRLLAEQATKHYPATESSGEFSTFDKEKFAELIVRDCISIVERHGSWIGVDYIKERFGIEE